MINVVQSSRRSRPIRAMAACQHVQIFKKCQQSRTRPAAGRGLAKGRSATEQGRTVRRKKKAKHCHRAVQDGARAGRDDGAALRTQPDRVRSARADNSGVPRQRHLRPAAGCVPGTVYVLHAARPCPAAPLPAPPDADGPQMPQTPYWTASTARWPDAWCRCARRLAECLLATV